MTLLRPDKLLVAILLVALLPGAALAESEKRQSGSKSKKSASARNTSAPEGPRVVVRAFEGPRAKKVHAWIVALVKEGDVDLVQDKGLGKLTSDAAYAAAAQKVNASAFITGKVKQSKGWSLEIGVRDGESGSEIERLSFSGASFNRLKADIEGSFWTKAADPIHVARAPEPAVTGRKAEAKREAEEAEEAEESTVSEDEDEAEVEETEEADEGEEAEAEAETVQEQARDKAGPEPRPSPLELLVAFRGFSRRFEFEDDLFGATRHYELGAAPAAFLGVSWYPLAHFQGGVPAHLGVMVGYEQAFLISTLNDTAQLKTRSSAFFGGVRARLPLGAHELAASFSYGQHSFTIDGDEARPFPDVKYSYLRPALEAAFRIDRASFGLQIGHRFLLSSGELESDAWFPRLTGAGFDAGLFVGRAIGKSFELRAGADLRRYYFTMHPRVGDRYVVGGGVDQYLSLWAGLYYRVSPSD